MLALRHYFIDNALFDEWIKYESSMNQPSTYMYEDQHNCSQIVMASSHSQTVDSHVKYFIIQITN